MPFRVAQLLARTPTPCKMRLQRQRLADESCRLKWREVLLCRVRVAPTLRGTDFQPVQLSHGQDCPCVRAWTRQSKPP